MELKIRDDISVSIYCMQFDEFKSFESLQLPAGKLYSFNLGMTLTWRSGASEHFFLTVSSQAASAEWIEMRKFDMEPYGVIMDGFSYPLFLAFLQSTIDACRSEDDDLFLDRLSRLFHSDFDPAWISTAKILDEYDLQKKRQPSKLTVRDDISAVVSCDQHAELESLTLPAGSEFRIYVQLTLNWSSGRSEKFGLVVSSSAAIAEQIERNDFAMVQHGMVMDRFEYPTLLAFLQAVIDACMSEDTELFLQRLSRLLHSHFDRAFVSEETILEHYELLRRQL